MELISHHQPEEFRKVERKHHLSIHFPESLLLASILAERCVRHQERLWIRMIGKPCGRAVLLGSLTYCSPPGCPFPIKSLALSSCVSLDNSFLSVRQEPSFGPWKGSPFLQQMATTKGHLLCWDWHPAHSGYSGASLPANEPDPAAATGTLLSLVSSWRGQLARVPRMVRNKRLYWPLSPSLPLSSP